MNKLAYYVLGMLIVIPFVWGVRINEVMYNPLGSDNNQEFVEIFGTDNLFGYTIRDLASNDSLELIKFISGNFSLIVEEGFNHTNINCSIYSAGATIGNNLNNGEDTIFLYYNNTLIDFMGYDGSLANNNGYSLELVNGSWQESCEAGGSPGKENCMIVNKTTNETINDTTNQTEGNETQEENEPSTGLKLEIVIPDTLFLGLIYDSLFKITNINHVSGVEDFVFVMVKYNVTKNDLLIKEDYFNKTINYYSSSNTGKLFFEETGNHSLCGVILNTPISLCKDFAVINPASIPCFIELNLSTDKELYLNREKVKIKNIISNKSFPYIIEYWVEDLFEEEVKKRYNTSNTNQKTYTPKIVEKDRVFFVKNRLVFVACNNSNTELENEKMIIIKKDKVSIGKDDDTDSHLGIDYVYVPRSGVLSFGDDFKVKMSIHKGDTSKSVVKVFVANNKNNNKVSDETKFYLNKKNSDYNLTVNVFLKPNCMGRFSDGYYDLVVEGLGKKTDEKIEINGNKKGVCKQEIIKKLGKISSFYTRSKKFQKYINLYANIDSPGIHDVVLLSKKGEQKKEVNGTKKIKFVAEPEPGLNLFILELRKGGEIVDTKNLFIELEGEEKKVSLKEKLLLEKNNKTVEEVNASVNYSLAPITGRVVYESDNVKIAKYAPYLLSFVLSLIIVGLILSKRR